MVDAGEDHFLGKGILKKVTARRETISDTLFTEGDLAIAIEWFDRTTDDDEGVSFEKWVDTEGDAAVQTIINSTELRAASSTPFDNGLHFTMAVEAPITPALVPRVVPPPAVTRSGRAAAVVALAAAPPLPDDTVHVMTASVDEQIRRGCWMGGRYM